MSSKEYHRINILGGGIKDKLLCQMASDACNVQVLAGPSEATLMGNIAVVLAALGELNGLSEIRCAVSNSTELKEYTPKDNAALEKAYADFVKILNK